MSLSSKHTATLTARTIGGTMLCLLVVSVAGHVLTHVRIKLGRGSFAAERIEPERIRPAHWHTPALPPARQLH